jgi:tetratricopeptide (TPR) repeat protein
MIARMVKPGTPEHVRPPSAKDFVMRFTPAALALTAALALAASAGMSAAPGTLDPRAAALVAQGRAELAAGNVNAAVDSFEAALTIAPSSVPILLQLGEAARRQGMQGKALRYYRQALVSEPRNLAAISGEGAALVEKGALEKARRNLTRLESLCGQNCGATQELAAAIAKGPAPRMVSAEQITPAPVVTQN